MTGLHDFIIELKTPLNDTFKTENGVELFAHPEFSVDRLSNRIAKVISTPIFHETKIQPGYEVMIEPTILYKQIYRNVTQGYTSLLDKENMLFKVTPNMIILYRENENDTWTGHLKNLLVKPIEDNIDQPGSSLIIIPESTIKKYKRERATLLYLNDELKEMGAKQGDEVFIDPLGGVKFWIDGVEHWWIRNIDTLGIAV